MKKSKKGLSTVISVLIMITLVIAAVVIVWGTVQALIENQTKGAESCANIYGKVEINSLYTCHNSTSNEVQFSIKIGDIDVDKIIIAISSEGGTESYEILSEGSVVSGLVNYTEGSYIILPGKNGGKTYKTSTGGSFALKPDAIEIAPVINEKQCEMSDSLYEIDDCAIII